MAFSKLKAQLRRIGAGIIDDLWKVVGFICDLYDSDECCVTASPLPAMRPIKRAML